MNSAWKDTRGRLGQTVKLKCNVIAAGRTLEVPSYSQLGAKGLGHFAPAPTSYPKWVPLRRSMTWGEEVPFSAGRFPWRETQLWHEHRPWRVLDGAAHIHHTVLGILAETSLIREAIYTWGKHGLPGHLAVSRPFKLLTRSGGLSLHHEGCWQGKFNINL